jgi:hypothetical protein
MRKRVLKKKKKKKKKMTIVTTVQKKKDLRKKMRNRKSRSRSILMDWAIGSSPFQSKPVTILTCRLVMKVRFTI